MSNIDQWNIDEWLFNHFEGNLNLEEQSQLMDFLNAHPEFAEDLDMWSNIRVEEPSMTYPNVDDLIREPEEVLPPHQSAGWYTVAAAAMMLLFAGGFLSYIVFSDSNSIPDGWPPVAENVIPFDSNDNASFLAEQNSGLTTNQVADENNNSFANTATNNLDGNYANVNNGNSAATDFASANESNQGASTADTNPSMFALVNDAEADEANTQAANGSENATTIIPTAEQNTTAADNIVTIAENNEENTSLEDANAANHTAIADHNDPATIEGAAAEEEHLEGAASNNLDAADANNVASNDGNASDQEANQRPNVTRTFNDGGFSRSQAEAGTYAEGRFADPEWAKRVLKTYEYVPRSYDALHEYAVTEYNPKTRKKSSSSYPAWQVPGESLAMQNLKTQHFVAANATPLQLNPAFAGDAEQHRIISSYRNQFATSNTMQPQSLFFSYDKNSDKLHGGFGLLASHEVLGENNSLTNVSAMYSYRIEIKERGSSQPAKLVIKPAVKMNVTRHTSDEYQGGSFSFNDYGLGLAIHSNKLFGAVAVDHLFEPGDRSLDLPTGTELMETRITGQLGTDFRNGAEGRFTLSPHALFESSAGDWYAGAGAVVRFGNFMAGSGYVHNSGARATIGLQTDNFRLGYAYELETENITTSNTNTHELGIQLLLK